MTKNKSIFCAFLILAISISVTFILMMDSNSNEYASLWVLPLITGVAFFIAFLWSAGKPYNFLMLFLIFLFFIRNIATPFAMRYGQYSSYFRNVDKSDVDHALILMLYETLCLLFYSIMRNRGKYDQLNDDGMVIDWNSTLHGATKITILGLVLFSVGLVVLNPSYALDFSNIFASSDFRNIQIGANATGPLYTIFTVIVPITYLSVAVWGMSYVNSKCSNGLIKTVLNLVCICIPFFFMNNSDGFTLISVVCLALASLNSNGISKRVFILIVMVGMSFIVIYIFSVTASMSFGASTKSLWQKISEMLQAYFPGVSNFAGLFRMSQHNKWTSLFYDFYYTIPFRNTLFGVPGDERLVILYTMDNNASSQVIPCAAQLYYYVGFFAPLIECFIIKTAIALYYRIKTESNLFLYFNELMCVVCLILTPIMYNLTLFLTRFFITILPMFILYKFLQTVR